MQCTYVWGECYVKLPLNSSIFITPKILRKIYLVRHLAVMIPQHSKANVIFSMIFSTNSSWSILFLLHWPGQLKPHSSPHVLWYLLPLDWILPRTQTLGLCLLTCYPFCFFQDAAQTPCLLWSFFWLRKTVLGAFALYFYWTPHHKYTLTYYLFMSF
jgi:hypothetical protein